MRWMLSGFVLAVAAAASPACAEDLRAVLSQRYQTIKAAMAGRDTHRLAPLLAPAFQSEELGGKVTDRAGLLAQLAALAPSATAGESRTLLVSVTSRGDTARVQQHYSHISQTGQPPHTIELLTQSSDTWTRVQGQWLLAATRTEAIDYRVDGKLIAHKTRDEAQQSSTNGRTSRP